MTVPISPLPSSHLSTRTEISLPSKASPSPAPPAQLIKKVTVDAAFWVKYGLFSYAGHTLGFLAAMLVTFVFTMSTYPDPFNLSAAETSALWELGAWIHWPVAGFFVGLAQWLAIRQWVPGALWWVPATVAGFWAIAFAVAIGYADPLSGVVVGVFVGLPQWAVMRQRSPRAGWWVLWSMFFTALLCRAISNDLFEVLGWFLMVPLLDGFFLSWILRRQHSIVGS